jgi:hypothetical protein
MIENHSPSKKESTHSPTAKSVLWDAEENTSHPSFLPIEVILQDWLSSGKHRLEMKLENSNLLWVPLANFLMRSSVNTVLTVEVSYLPTSQVVIFLTQ